MLPAFTLPGSNAQRIESFIRHLKKFFSVTLDNSYDDTSGSHGVPVIGVSDHDILQLFFSSSYGSTFKFSDALQPTTLHTKLQDLFTQDEDGQLVEWVENAVTVLQLLYQLASSATDQAPLLFSIMEALYSRGFITAASVSTLDDSQFKHALQGTVAYEHFDKIKAKAQEIDPSTSSGAVPGGPFAPVNSGDLINCIPPENLSPFGLIECWNMEMAQKR